MGRTRILFWKPAHGHDPWDRPDPGGRAVGNLWAERLRQGLSVEQLEPIPSQGLVDAILRRFPEAQEEGGVVRLDRPDADLTIRWSAQHVEVDARELWVSPSQAIEELAAELGLDWFDFRW